MSKVYLETTLSIIVDTDLLSIDSIIDNIDFSAIPNSENVEVYDCQVKTFSVTDSK